jgi:hypothetical protein
MDPIAALALGESVVFRYDLPFSGVQLVNGFVDSTTVETVNKYLIKEFRYSIDNIQFSLWDDMTTLSLQNIVLSDPIWIEARYTREGSDNSGVIDIFSFELDLTYKKPDKFQRQDCRVDCSSCEEIATEVNTAVNMYPIDRLSCLKNQIEYGVTKQYGRVSKYWRSIPDDDSRDVIFKEYSLNNVQAFREIRILIPKNALPDAQVQFTMTDMEFYEMPFEIHINRAEWEAVFGVNTSPGRKDIIYICVLDRLYHIESAYQPKGTGFGTFFKVNLVKFQDEVGHGYTEDVRQELDDLIESVEDIFGAEADAEIIQATKPQQLTFQATEFDDVREQLKIKPTTYSLENNWSVVSKNYYDLTGVAANADAVVYRSAASVSDVISITGWVRINPLANLANDQVVLYGSNGVDKGVKMYINSAGLNIWFNNTVYTFAVPFVVNSWYGIVINVSIYFKQVNVSVFTIPPFDRFVNTEGQSSKLLPFFSENRLVTTLTSFSIDDKWKLVGSQLDFTNLRIFNKIIDEVNQPKVLSQFIVKDNQFAIVIDNALEQLDLIYRKPFNNNG